MPLTLDEVLIPGWTQQLEASARVLDKAEGWASERGISEEALLAARLADDMLPLAYQFKSCWVHSALAIERCREGTFSPHLEPPPATYASLRDLLARALAELRELEPGALEAIASNDMAFVMGGNRMEFTVQDFLLSFSLPNFYFHAATAYDILRAEGMPIGKRDFLGRPRLKPS